MCDSATEGYFGLCPECKNSDGYLNVGKSHFGICKTHRVCWPIGWNLFSSWRDETEADWDRNAELLCQFREVKPFRPALPRHNEPLLVMVRQAVA